MPLLALPRPFLVGVVHLPALPGAPRFRAPEGPDPLAEALDAPALAAMGADPAPFADPFAAEPAGSIAAFESLGRDAFLVAPRPLGAAVDCAHLASFVRSADEDAIVELWQMLLHVDRIGIHDDFFQLGGHSMLAMQMSAQLEDMVGFPVPLEKLFDARTTAELAVVLEALSDELEEEELADHVP